MTNKPPSEKPQRRASKRMRSASTASVSGVNLLKSGAMNMG